MSTRVTEYLKQLDASVNLTCDAWSSKMYRGYIVYCPVGSFGAWKLEKENNPNSIQSLFNSTDWRRNLPNVNLDAPNIWITEENSKHNHWRCNRFRQRCEASCWRAYPGTRCRLRILSFPCPINCSFYPSSLKYCLKLFTKESVL